MYSFNAPLLVRRLRRAFVVSLAVVLLPAAEAAQAESFPDAQPTEWHLAARTDPLLSAPPPPVTPAICVVDTGVNLTPDLAPVVVGRYAIGGGTVDDVSPGSEGGPPGHGTHVATFAAGQVNGWGSAGTWPHARIVSVRVFPEDGGQPTPSAYLDGLKKCHTSGYDVRVINLSLNELDTSDEGWREIEDQITDLRVEHGINVVVAAGNGGGAVERPASFPAAFAVGAIDDAGDLCSFSAAGAGLDLLAPGCGLRSADFTGSPVDLNGTSFAAPQVASVLLALRSYSQKSADEAEALVTATARPTPGGPLLDASAALAAAGIAWQAVPPTRSVEAPATTSAGNSSQFVSYPRPRIRWQFRPGRSRLILRALNRPKGVDVRVLIGRRWLERRSSTLRIRTRTLQTVTVRYVSDVGISPRRVIRPLP